MGWILIAAGLFSFAGGVFGWDWFLNSRRARAESMEVQLQTTRFVRKEVGGPLGTSTAAVISTESFSNRMPRANSDKEGDQQGGGQGNPPPQTEEAIEGGLAFLSRQQQANGGWSFQSIPNEQALLVSDTAATGLALLAFQGAGYNHREFKYADTVYGGIHHLLKNQKPDGDLFIPLDDESNKSVRLYSHGIAAIALCEAYGMTQDPDLKEPAQRAIDFIVAAQDPKSGGWRYTIA